MRNPTTKIKKFNKTAKNTTVKNGGILSGSIFNVNSMRFGVLTYFLLFSFCILLVMWLFQILFARNYHNNIRWQNVSEICDVAAESLLKGEEYNLQSVAKTNGFNMYVFNDVYMQCLQGYDSNGQEDKKVESLGWTTPEGKFDSAKINEVLQLIKNSPTSEYCQIENDFMGVEGESIVYLKAYKQTLEYQLVLFVYVPMYPLTSIMSTLSAQLIVVTLAALLLSVVVGSILSVQVSKSMEKMSQNAKVLATGNYSVRFEGNGFTEVDDLSDSLNYATRALAKAETVRKDIMANVSHDLRTPLTLIKSYAEMVRDLSGDDKVKREKHLNTIIKEAERLTNMVNDILKLSKSEKMGELNMEKYDFSQQVNEIIDMMIDGNSKDFVVERDVTPKIYACLDKQKISQVIINFLSNAFKYSGDNKYVRVVLKQYGDKLRFDVIDKGIGISKEELPYVWDRYTKASLKHKMGDSNGIGLSIAKSILLRHNGKYGVNSELGKGSDFYFELPTCQE